MARRDGNPGCGWFLAFWGAVVLTFLVANELFGPVSLLDKFQEKWELLGEKSRQRRAR